MKRFLCTFAVLLAVAVRLPVALAAAAPAAPITSLAVLHSLTNEQASRALPVAFEGVVTYYRRGDEDLFVQEGVNSIYVDAARDLRLGLGDRVRITGHTEASFRPQIKADSVQFLGRDKAPKAVPATFREMIRGDLDTRRVTVRGVVVGADWSWTRAARSSICRCGWRMAPSMRRRHTTAGSSRRLCLTQKWN